jgi:hypothetical protein
VYYKLGRIQKFLPRIKDDDVCGGYIMKDWYATKSRCIKTIPLASHEPGLAGRSLHSRYILQYKTTCYVSKQELKS